MSPEISEIIQNISIDSVPVTVLCTEEGAEQDPGPLLRDV